MGLSLKDCCDARPTDFTWSTLGDLGAIRHRAERVGDILIPHAALAAAHRDDVPDSRQLFRTGGRPASFPSGRAMRSFLQLDLDVAFRHADALASFCRETANALLNHYLAVSA